MARHSVACFLTRGHLWISWEDGMKVFDELLLDADWSVNAGTWMWLSCSSFFTQFFPVYDPVKFGRKVDPNGDYIRRYVPVLKNYPIKYIHEPWMAPEQVQKAAKCVIGTDYPKPMIDHEMAANQNQERMKQVYQQLSTYQSQESDIVTSSMVIPDNRRTSSEQQATGQTSSNKNISAQSSSGTFVTSTKYPTSNVTVHQRELETELMPAPIAPSVGASSSGQFQHSGQQRTGQPQKTIHFTPGVTNPNQEDKALDIDDLTPSINNYQTRVVSNTLEYDQTQLYNQSHGTVGETTNYELDQFLDIANTTSNEQSNTQK